MLDKSRYLNEKNGGLLDKIMSSDIDIPGFFSILDDTYSQALEANDPDADPDEKDDKKDDADDKKEDDKSDNKDPDTDSDDNTDASDDDKSDDEDNQSDEGEDPDFTKGADPGASSDSDGGAGSDGNAAPSGGAGGSTSSDVEPPKNEEEKEEKVKDISERIHLYSCYSKLASLVESLVNNMQSFVDACLSIEQRNVILRIKQELIKTSGQLEFAMALDFKTTDFSKLEELYDIINTKIKKFMEALEKVKKAKDKK